MILPIFRFCSSTQTNYEEIKRQLLQLGLSPTGNPEIDKSKLKRAINNQIEKFKLELEEIKITDELIETSCLEEERLGAQALAEQYRIYFKI